MPSIHDLLLTISKDSAGVITANISYTILEPVPYDALYWQEYVVICAQLGADRRPFLLYGYSPGTDPEIVTIHDELIRVDKDWPPEVKRSYEHIFEPAELKELLRAGRERPYVVAALNPRAAQSYAIADVNIDVGDPGEGPVIIVPPPG